MSVQGEKLKEIADAIRSKTGKTEQIKASDFANEILNIQSGSSEPTKYGAYNIEVVEKDDGTQELHITDAVEKPVDMLQAMVDETKSCAYLLYNYTGKNADVIKNLDTSNATSMKSMFYGCQSLTSIPQLDTSNVTDMSFMFSDCYLLTSIPQLDTSNVKTMARMFDTCSKLTTIPPLDTSNVTNMTGMFEDCLTLTDILGTLDMIKLSNITNTFANCRALTTVTLKNIKAALTIGSGTSYGTLLDDPTIINTAKELWDLTGATSQKLTVSTPTNAKFDTIYVKLITATDEMIANDPNINSKKPCEVCESTDDGAMTLREYIISKNWSIA